jgi:hypothetical protein
MNRTYHFHDDHVSFLEYKEYYNHSKLHFYQRPKGSFYTRSKILQWLIGYMGWKIFGIGGRR